MTQHRRSCPVQWLKERGVYTSTEWLLSALKHKEGGLYICRELVSEGSFSFLWLKEQDIYVLLWPELTERAISPL